MTARTLFESLALAQISSHLSQKEHICDIDKVTALGFAPMLGSLLIRLKGGNDAASYSDARHLIASRLAQIGKRQGWGGDNRLLRVADEALQHYLKDWCQPCGGRGIVKLRYTKGPQEEAAGETCETCGGSGKAARNVQKRAYAISVPGDIPKRLEAVLDCADGLVERAGRLATGISRAKLYGVE